MNYRHAFHAGNFADVVKHIALVSILSGLKRKPAPFIVIDTHAGRGLYDLGGAEALRSGEARTGIARIRDIEDGPDALRAYLELVRACGPTHYPGSPWIAARSIRDGDRLVAVEKQPEDAAALKTALGPFRRARVISDDGFRLLPSLLPPPERRGVVLIDPPYEAPDEFERVARAAAGALARFATGIVVVWFPIKSRASADAFCGEVLASGPRKLLRLDIAVDAAPGKLGAAGLLIANAPFGFAGEMDAVLRILAPRLGDTAPARFRVERLAGGD